MSSSVSIQDERAAQRKGKPEWVESFLQRTFFSSCAIHEPPKNELNKYCTDCNLSVCRHCIDAGSHAEHKVLQIYRHVYKDVVPLREMEKHIDCSKIQAYKCNKQLVIALNPLPHSGSQTTEEAACDKCKRKLLDPNANRYCSIACKVQAFLRKETGLEPPCLSLQSPTLERRPKLRRPKRPRKGVPHRAPLS